MKARLEMNLGIIAASIATLRPLFVNLGPMVRVTSDTPRWPYASNQPFAKFAKASKTGTGLTGTLLSPMGSTKTNDLEAEQDIREASDGRGEGSV